MPKLFVLKNKLINWLLFAALSFIWGSSFVLMKEGLKSLSAYEVATIRILSAGLVLIPFAYKALKQIPKQKLGLIILSGLLGSFFPAFLFCIAETKIDSALAGILNALTTLFAFIIGILFYDMKAELKKIIGIVVGFIGLLILFGGNGKIDLKNTEYASLILIATIFYGVNVNMVGKHMKGISSLNIATIAFVFLIIPCIIILWITGFFALPFNTANIVSISASSVLGIMGTAVASILFYMLIKRAGALFSSMVTYGIPFVAVFWGIVLGEEITFMQLFSLGIILLGVYITNYNKNPFSKKAGVVRRD